MTPLKRRLIATIAATGPIDISQYMAQCLFDPQDGYYTTREPFGASGDFVTAPEISQMFGELIGVRMLSAWRAIGAPSDVVLAEIGPGRGTLMADMLRTLRKLDATLLANARIAMIEASPRLAQVQRQTLAGSGVEISWHGDVASLPHGTLLLVGNEIFDAVPVRQFVRAHGGWRERMVGLDAGGAMTFVAGAGTLDAAMLPAGAREASDGAILELSPQREALMAALAQRIAGTGGYGLFVDYGHALPGIGDTLQAVRRHRPEGVLEHPGEADLTAHVDFHALALEADRHGLATRLTSQGDFLTGLGLVERAGALGARADEGARKALRAAVERLAGPEAMGTLFKVLEIAKARHLAVLDAG